MIRGHTNRAERIDIRDVKPKKKKKKVAQPRIDLYSIPDEAKRLPKGISREDFHIYSFVRKLLKGKRK